MEELEEPSERLELLPPQQLVKIMDRGWRSDDIKIFDGGGNTHTHIVVSICMLVSLLLSGRGYGSSGSSGTGFSATS
jgi:hypothetical protein